MDPDNLGMEGCMLQSITEKDCVNITLESTWQDFCMELPAADIVVITAVALGEATVPKRDGPHGATCAQDLWFGRQAQSKVIQGHSQTRPLHAMRGEDSQ